MPDIDGDTGVVNYEIKTAGSVCEDEVRIRILDADGNEVAAADGAGGTVRIPDARLWWPWPGEPYLYTASVTYGEDLYEETFGIRTVAVEGTQFLIKENRSILRALENTRMRLSVEEDSMCAWMSRISI